MNVPSRSKKSTALQLAPEARRCESRAETRAAYMRSLCVRFKSLDAHDCDERQGGLGDAVRRRTRRARLDVGLSGDDSWR